MNFRFTLGEFFVLRDMPEGWRELTLNIKRKSEANAIYTDWTSELTFWGDGWDRLKYYLDGVGICARIPCKIEIDRRDTGYFRLLYQGVIALSDCEINYERQTIMGPIKSDSYLDYIASRHNMGVWYFNSHKEEGTQLTFGGQPVETTNFAKYLTLHDVVTGEQPAPDFFPQISFAYKVSDVLSYHLQYMTDNNVSAISDLFTQTPFLQGEQELTFPVDLQNGDEVQIQFINCFGKLIDKTITIVGATDSERYDQVAKEFVQKGDFYKYIPNNPVPATENAKAKCAYAYFDGSMFSWSDSNPDTQTVTLYNLTPYTNFSVFHNGDPVTLNVTQALQYGLANLFLGFNNELSESANNGAIGDKLITFDRLFNMLDSHFDIGMNLEGVSSDFVMRVEPKSYFYNKPEIISIGDIRNLKAKQNDEVLLQNLIVGTKGANSNVVKGASGKRQNWATPGCAVTTKDKNTDGNFDISAIGLQYTRFPGEYPVRYPDDVAFILSTAETMNEGAPGFPVLSAQYKIRVINGTGETIQDGSTEGTLYSYNAAMLNYWAVFNHLFSMTGSPKAASTNPEFPGYYVVKNSDNAFARKNYEIDCLLSDDQAKRCIILPVGRIGYRGTDNKRRSDSLFELEWNVNTKRAKIKVFG